MSDDCCTSVASPISATNPSLSNDAARLLAATSELHVSPRKPDASGVSRSSQPGSDSDSPYVPLRLR